MGFLDNLVPLGFCNSVSTNVAHRGLGTLKGNLSSVFQRVKKKKKKKSFQFVKKKERKKKEKLLCIKYTNHMKEEEYHF